MELSMVEEAGVKAMEGQPGAPFMTSVDDAVRVIEACFSNRVSAALLYADNLTSRFFDLSSGQAGAILQKMRNYGLRLAVVCPKDSVPFSTHFGDMVTEERKGRHFGLFESREAAREWLSRF